MSEGVLGEKEAEGRKRLVPGSLWWSGSHVVRIAEPPDKRPMYFDDVEGEGPKTVYRWQVRAIDLTPDTREWASGGYWLDESCFPFMEPYTPAQAASVSSGGTG